MMLLWILLAEGIRDSEIMPEINTEIHLEKKKRENMEEIDIIIFIKKIRRG